MERACEKIFKKKDALQVNESRKNYYKVFDSCLWNTRYYIWLRRDFYSITTF